MKHAAAVLIIMLVFGTLAPAAEPVPDLSTLAVATPTPKALPGSLVDEENRDPAAAGPRRFAAGSWEVPVYGSVTFGYGPGELYLTHVGVSYYLKDDFAASFEGVSGFADGDDSGTAFGFDLLFRWHLLRQDRWSLYVDGGAGILYTAKSFKTDSTHFNFTPQAGIGTTWHLNEKTHFMVGTRWHHVSNADIKGPEHNLNHDAPMVYGGVMITF